MSPRLLGRLVVRNSGHVPHRAARPGGTENPKNRRKREDDANASLTGSSKRDKRLPPLRASKKVSWLTELAEEGKPFLRVKPEIVVVVSSCSGLELAEEFWAGSWDTGRTE